MTINIPTNIRIALYVLTVLASPLIAYLNATGHIGENEVTMFAAYVAAIAAMAGFNVPSSKTGLK